MSADVLETVDAAHAAFHELAALLAVLAHLANAKRIERDANLENIERFWKGVGVMVESMEQKAEIMHTASNDLYDLWRSMRGGAA